MIIGHHESVIIHHDALEARIGTHVLADRLAHEAGIAPGRKGIEHHPEPLPWAQCQGQKAHTQFTDGCEVPNECRAGPPGDQYPYEVFACLEADLSGIPWLFVKA